MRRTLGFLASALLTLAVVLGAAVALIDGDDIEPLAEEYATSALGLAVTMDGLSIDKTWPPSATAHGLRVANPDWAGDDTPALAAERATASIRVEPLFQGRFSTPTVTFEGATLDIARHPERGLNWAAGGGGGGTLPLIQDLTLTDFELTYRELDGSYAQTILLDVEGSADGDGLRLSGTASPPGYGASQATMEGGALRAFFAREERWPVRITLEGPVTGMLDGAIKPGAINLDSTSMSLDGESLAALGAWLGVSLPETPPWSASMVLDSGGREVRFDDLRVSSGSSAARGSLLLQGGEPRSTLSGELTGEGVRLADVVALAGDGDGDGAASEAPAHLPSAAVPVEMLRNLDLDIEVSAPEFEARGTRIGSFQARFRSEGERLTVEPLAFDFAEGRAEGRLTVDATSETPRSGITVSFDSVGIEPLFEGMAVAEKAAGDLRGELDLEGSGKTLAEMLLSASGGGWAGIEEGEISGFLLAAASLDYLAAAGAKMFGSEPAPVRCAAGAVIADGAIWRVENGALASEGSVLLIDGTIDLRDLTMDMTLVERPVGAGEAGAGTPIALSGPLASPDYEIGAGDPQEFDPPAAGAVCERIVARARAAAPGG